MPDFWIYGQLLHNRQKGIRKPFIGSYSIQALACVDVVSIK